VVLSDAAKDLFLVANWMAGERLRCDCLVHGSVFSGDVCTPLRR
jgi:hypothetical protein